MGNERSIVRSSLLVTAFTVAAALLGFLSQVVIAFLFGASAQLDAYLTAGALPLSFSGLVLGGIGFTLIPILSNTREDDIPQTITSCLLATLGVAAGIAVVGAFVSQYTLRWTAPGLSAQKLSLCVHLQGFFWVAAGFTVIASFFVGVSHFYKRFLVPAASTLVTPLCTILAGLLLGRAMGIYSIAVGYLLGCMLQCVIVFLAVASGRRLFSPKLSTAARQFLRSSVPVLISLLPFTAISVMDAFWCSSLPDGSLSYLGYANRIAIGLTGVTVQGISLVIFPFLSDHAAAGEMGLIQSRIASALRFVFIVMVPGAALLAVLRIPVLTLVFQRGNFNEQSTQGLALVLPWYLVGMIGMSGMALVGRGFYAISDLNTPMYLGVASLVTYFCMSGLLSAWFSYVGVGMAYALYWTLQFIVAGTLLGRHIGGFWRLAEMRFFAKIAGVSVAVGAIIEVVDLHARLSGKPFLHTVYLCVFGSLLLVLFCFLLFDANEKGWVLGAVHKSRK